MVLSVYTGLSGRLEPRVVLRGVDILRHRKVEVHQRHTTRVALDDRARALIAAQPQKLSERLATEQHRIATAIEVAGRHDRAGGSSNGCEQTVDDVRWQGRLVA